MWNPQANGIVYAITLKGTDVIIGGSFTFLKYAPEIHLASVNKVSGLVDPES
jgi:hypothetical protein